MVSTCFFDYDPLLCDQSKTFSGSGNIKKKMEFLGRWWLTSAALVLSLFWITADGQLLTTFNIPTWENVDKTKIDDEPLILTHYIESGNYGAARRLAKVDESLFLNVTSYAGYLTVEEEHNSNLFFWFFPAEGTEHLYEDDYDNFDGEDEDTDYDHPFLKKLIKRPKVDDSPRLDDEKPVVLWLQGGPGVSSMFALFTENGPFFIDEKDPKSIRPNPHSWHKNYSILFIDNPVGTGFSFTDEDGYVTNMTQVAKHLYKGLLQFFDLFPFLKGNDFFITGESFAGKYIPAIGNEIYEQNLKNKNGVKINLQGLALGNAFSDPINMFDYSEYAYQLGLVGLAGYQEMKILETLLQVNFDTPTAKPYWDSILSSFSYHSNYSNLYNIQQPEAMNLGSFVQFVTQPEIRKALHVGSHNFNDSNKVYVNLIPDFLTTAMHWVERLLNAGLRVLYYNGNWDLIVAYPLSENAFQKMHWSGAAKYRKAERQPFYVNGRLKGYIKKADNFYEAAVLNAGHMVPTDQPEACLQLINNFFLNLI